MSEEISHPEWYGGEDDPYEVIKVLRAWDLELAKGFAWGNVIKYEARAGKKGTAAVADRQKAEWYATELVSIEAELAGRAMRGVRTFRVNGTANVDIDWENRSYEIHYLGGGGQSTVKYCNSSFNCVGGYHARRCPLHKEPCS